MTTTVRHRTVLTYEGVKDPNGCLVFEATDEPGLPRSCAVAIPEEKWADLGSPMTITVAIVAGDRLNEPPEPIGTEA